MEMKIEDVNGNVIDLGIKKKVEDSQFLSRRFRTVQKRWKKLTNVETHNRLKNAIKNELYTQKHGNTDGGHDIADFDPLEDHFW